MSSLLAILIISVLASNAAAQFPSFRLPTNVKPSQYHLTIQTDLPSFTFWGSIGIYANVAQSTDTIVMHSKDLLLSNIEVLTGDILPTTNVFVRHDFVTERDLLRLFLTQNVTTGSVLRIGMNFNGTLGTGNVGYYRASYVNEANQTRYMAITHLEATNARRVFPCFDQPDFKATFQINLIRANGLITAANTYQTSSWQNTPTTMYDIYATSPIMSTYLIAFMVSDYDKNSTTVNSIVYETFGRQELIRRGEGTYSVTVGPKAIAAMTNITRTSYALTTMDQVAVPNDFYRIGAMENWGMITYRERYLMHNEQTSTAAEKQFTTTIISHEIAHQWFGNRVTPEWWRYIWLNEGFATYFEMYTAAVIEPTWKMNEQFVTSMLQRALDDDAWDTTRAMTRDAESPDQIDAQYDTIVYEKAGSVIRMMAGILGDTVFENGLVWYFDTYSFQNVAPQHLYASWQRSVSNSLNVSNIMTPWETQPGYPVLTVTREGNNASIRQDRFYIDRAATNVQTVWPIQLTWLTVNETINRNLWLTGRTGDVNLNLDPEAWVIFNVNQMGFYRVNYDANNWRLIRNYLWNGSFSAIPVINRAQVIDDAFNLARSGRLNQSTALEIGSYIQNETEYVPILTFTRAFAHLDRLFTGTDLYDSIREYGIAALGAYFNRTGFIQQNNDHITKLTKVQVLTWLCNLGHASCRTNSRQVFTNWISQNTLIQPDSQGYIFCNGIRNGTLTEWETTLQRYTALREATQRTRIAQGLGCALNTTVLQRLLNLVSDQNSPFSQSDKVPTITSVYTNNGVTGVDVVLQWLRTNFAVINQRVGSVASIVRGVANRITTAEQISLFNQFVTQNSNSFTASLNTTISSSLTTANANIQWANNTSEDIEDYFKGNASGIYYQIFVLLACIIISLLCK